MMPPTIAKSQQTITTLFEEPQKAEQNDFLEKGNAVFDCTVVFLHEARKNITTPDKATIPSVHLAISEESLEDIGLFEETATRLLSKTSQRYSKKIATMAKELIEKARKEEQLQGQQETPAPVNMVTINNAIGSIYMESGLITPQRTPLIQTEEMVYPERAEMQNGKFEFQQLSTEEIGTSIAAKIHYSIETKHFKPNATELLERDWFCCKYTSLEEGKKDSVSIYYPRGTFENDASLMQGMKEVVQTHRDAQKLVRLESEQTRYFLIPDKSMFGQNVGAFCAGTEIYTPCENELNTGYTLHEAIHAILNENFGPSLVDIMVEGPTTLFEGEYRQVTQFSEQTIPTNQSFLRDKLRKLPTSKISFDPNIMFAELGEAGTVSAKYYYGRFFMATFVTNYGYPKYKELYKTTSYKAGALFDWQTGEQLVFMGKKETSDDRVMDSALASVGIEPVAMKQKLKEFAK